MSAFKRFGPGDQIDNVLVLEPLWTIASGTSGWKGAPEGSASVSLYGGYNRKHDGVVREYRFQRTVQGTDSFGVLARSEPITASMNYVCATDEDLNLAQRSSTRWGHEHWKTVQRLYDYYSRRDPDYVTSSYDHYCLFFVSGSTNIVTYSDRTQTGPNRFRCLPTGSFTFEAWFKPFVSGTPGNDLTVFSRARSFKLKIDGDTNRLVFAQYDGTSSTVPSAIITGSTDVVAGEWHHAAVVSDSASTMQMFLDLEDQGSAAVSSALSSPDSYTGSFHIGAEWGGTIASNQEDPSDSAAGLAGTVFHGFIGEVRCWGVQKTWAQISSSHNHRITGAALAAPLLAQFRLSEGPLAKCVPASDPSGLQWIWSPPSQAQGSGTVNWASAYQGQTPDSAFLYSFNSRLGPTWHPNDNHEFYVPKRYAVTAMSGTNWGPSGSAAVERLRIITVPAGMYGRQIAPGSVSITDRAYSHHTYRLVRTLIDDGRGGLFLSGSARSGSYAFASNSTYATASWYNANPTSSIDFVAKTEGPLGNGYAVNQFVFGAGGDPNFYINESDPTDVTIVVPFDEFDNPTGTVWQFYQFMASSSAYVSPTALHGDPDNIVVATLFGPTGGGEYGVQDVSREPSEPQYRGVEWNKVGNVFYDEGLIVIKDPALLDFGTPTDYVSSHPKDLLQVSFRGSSRVPVKTLMCRIDRGDINASLNQTFYHTEEDGDRVRRHPSGSIYVTTVGIYNSDRELVGVARLAEPLRVRPRDRMNVKLRMDF